LIAKIAILFYFPKLLREKVAIRKWENDVLGVYFTQRVQILYFIKKWAKKQIFWKGNQKRYMFFRVLGVFFEKNTRNTCVIGFMVLTL
jgi:hypothetical protein